MKTWTGELTVFDVATEGSNVRVDLVGGDQMVCGWVLYEFEDEIESQRNAEVLVRWRDQGTPVLAFTDDDNITLVDPQATVENLLDELSTNWP
jgi:hypothetical protein